MPHRRTHRSVVSRGLRALAGVIIAALASTGAASAAPVLVADRVDSSGRFVGETLPADPDGSPESLAAYVPPTARGARKVAVIPMEFSAQTAPWTTDAIRQAVFTGPSSVNALIKESTYDRLWIAGRDAVDGDVYQTVTISADTTTCSQSAWGDAALAALQGQGASITGDGSDGYQHYVFLFPHVDACAWAGLGQMPGRKTWINGSLSAHVISHELGHNFGLAHASSLNCVDGASARVVLSDACTKTEYGDPFDPMGAKGRQFSGVARGLIGTFEPGESLTVTGPTTLTLDTVSLPGASVRSIEIPRPGTTQSWFVEARAVAGRFDAYALTDQVLQGVLIRRRDGATRGAAPTELIDAHPATTSFNDAAFVPGETFVDPAGISVTVVARTATSATVTVGFGAYPPPSDPGGAGGGTSGGGTTTDPGTSSGTAATPTSTVPTPDARTVATGDSSVRETASLAVAKRWPSRLTVRRLADGRAVVVTRYVTRAKRCGYRVRGVGQLTGRCAPLAGAIGWRVTRTVRAGGAVTVTLMTPTRTLVTRRVRVPAASGAVRYYRL